MRLLAPSVRTLRILSTNWGITACSLCRSEKSKAGYVPCTRARQRRVNGSARHLQRWEKILRRPVILSQLMTTFGSFCSGLVLGSTLPTEGAFPRPSRYKTEMDHFRGAFYPELFRQSRFRS